MRSRRRSIIAAGLMLVLAGGGHPTLGQEPEQAAVRSRITVSTADGRSREVIHSSPRLFEAPNWSPDGTDLLLNSGGSLWRLPVGGGEPRPIPTGSITGINNDHGIAPDGQTLAISAGPIYVLPAGGGEPRRVTQEVPSYFHGWSPDGRTLAYCGKRGENFDLYAIPVAGGAERRLTTHAGYDDGPDYSPDGRWIYFNSDRSGSWDIWRIPADGAGPGDAEARRITSDDLEDWFPHPSPDGKWLVFLSFEKGTKGHPPDRPVVIRRMPLPGEPIGPGEVQEVVRLFGGQGTMNVNSWSPDGRRFAYVSFEPVRCAANVPVEVEFLAQRDHPDPFHSVTLDVVFRARGGRTARVPAFWAGGNAWKVRYASGEPGTLSYRAECSDPSDHGLHGVEGRVEVGPYAGDNPLFRHGPIQVAADGRHFAHADGTPFFWLGDTWWMGLSHRLRWPDEFASLAADRQAKGFTVVQIVAGLYPDMPPFDPRGANEAGFPWEEGYTRIRPAYFDAADRRLRDLVDRGISPCIVGMWGYYLPWMGVARAQQHWRYLIARYGAWPVTWCVAGEANLPWYLAEGFPYDDREQVRGWTEVLRFVRETDPFRRPVTIHPTAIGRYTSRHATDDSALLDFDMLQTPHGQREAAPVTLAAVRGSFAAEPVMPVVNGEASYERLMDRLPTEWTRAMFWLCMTSGAAGHTYGANGIWQCNRRGQPHGASPHGSNYGVIPWDEAMNLPGSAQVGAAKRFLEQFPWDRFEPHPEWVAWDDEATDGPARPRDAVPPLGLGLTDGPRIFYMLDARPVLFRGLAPGRSYRVMEFDPVAGTTGGAGGLTADSDGRARRPAPVHGHDWVVALIPSPEEDGKR